MSSHPLRVTLTLRMVGEAESHRTCLLEEGQKLVLGRSPGVTLRLNSPQISRRHAALLLNKKGLWAVDFGSRNGTFVGKRRLPSKKPILVPADGLVRLDKFLISHTLQSSASQPDFDEALVLRTLGLSAEEYEILGHLGQGAGGSVWAARQKLIDRKVALKVLLTPMDVTARQRFLREARLLFRAKSPHIVECYDIRLTPDRTPVLFLELVQGPTAKALVTEGGPLELGEALTVAEHVALALAKTTDLGIVHRDVKPENIILTPERIAKLTDFGLAKGGDDEGLTREGVGMGTLSYVPPEQLLSAKTADHRADIYSLGATLYYLLAGRPPFEQDKGVSSLLKKIQHERPPPLHMLVPRCPEEIDQLVQWTLAKSPQERPQSPALFVEALRVLQARFAEKKADLDVESTFEIDLDELLAE